MRPIVHRNYDGRDLVLPDDPTYVLREADNPELKEQHGNDIITASGLTLLGADDKAGVAEIMGEMILCLDTITGDPRVVIEEGESVLRMVERFVDDAMVAVQTDDTGLWEYRTFPNKYTFSHVLCWVAASRGAKVARRFGRESLAAQWETCPDAATTD